MPEMEMERKKMLLRQCVQWSEETLRDQLALV